MTSNRTNKTWISLTAVLLTAFALGGCDSREKSLVEERGPDWANASIKPLPLGKPFILDGCTVQLHRVLVSTKKGAAMDVTMSTASCPTAKVTATNENCGKNCEQDTLQVQPITPAAVEDTSPVDTAQAAPVAVQ